MQSQGICLVAELWREHLGPMEQPQRGGEIMLSQGIHPPWRPELVGPFWEMERPLKGLELLEETRAYGQGDCSF